MLLTIGVKIYSMNATSALCIGKTKWVKEPIVPYSPFLP